MNNSAANLRLDAKVWEERYQEITISEITLLYIDENETSLYLSPRPAAQSLY